MKKSIKRIAFSGIMLALIIVGAYIKVPIPYVPFTLQFLFVTLSGQLLGAKNAGMVVATYLVMGLLGFPVFTSGGGFTYIFEPTFGYLIGFVFAAIASGYITKNYRFKFRRYIANFVGIMCMYFCGVIYLYFICNLYMGQAIGVGHILGIGIVAQLPGDIVLAVVSARLAEHIEKLGFSI